MAAIRPLSEALAEIAKNELYETPERIESDLKALKDWLVTNPHLNACTDDQYLLAFLRGSKFSLEKTKEKLDAYYTMQTAIPEIKDRRDPKDLKTEQLLKKGVFFPISNGSHGKDAPVICLVQAGIYDAIENSFADAFAMGFIVSEMLLPSNDHYVVCGQIMLIDLQHLTMPHIIQTTPLQLKNSMYFGKNALPIRQKFIHFINAPTMFTAVYNTLKALLPRSMKDRMMIHESFEELHKHIPKSALPQEYGGDKGPLSEMITSWVDQVMQQRDRLVADKKYGVDESKRQQKSSFLEGLDGMDGSFRKLIVD